MKNSNEDHLVFNFGPKNTFLEVAIYTPEKEVTPEIVGNQAMYRVYQTAQHYYLKYLSPYSKLPTVVDFIMSIPEFSKIKAGGWEMERMYKSFLDEKVLSSHLYKIGINKPNKNFRDFYQTPNTITINFIVVETGDDANNIRETGENWKIKYASHDVHVIGKKDVLKLCVDKKVEIGSGCSDCCIVL